MVQQESARKQLSGSKKLSLSSQGQKSYRELTIATMIESQAAKHPLSDNLNKSGLRWWGQGIDFQLTDRQ